jgi:cell division GTPase FtsZ
MKLLKEKFIMSNEVMNENATIVKESFKNTGNHVVIGLGNCGSQIVRAIATRKSLNDVDLFSIDSVVSNTNLANVNRIKTIPIITDEKEGSGRNRERGAAMYAWHEANHEFDKMYETCENAKSPVVVITSAAGGTGSGSAPKLCKTLNEAGIPVIPIIVCPSMDDPTAYHLNNNDLFMELEEARVETYCVFRNVVGDSNYTPINNEIVDLVEIIFGKKYGSTTRDSIDDSDLATILSTPGRFVAVSAKATDITNLTREITRKLFTGYQPSWTDEEAKQYTFMTAYSLKSMFAGTDFKQVFDEVRSRIYNWFDEYRNIEQTDNGGEVEASVIIAGLPRPEIKIIQTEFNGAEGIGSGMKRAARPKFLSRKKASIGTDASGKKTFSWSDK